MYICKHINNTYSTAVVFVTRTFVEQHAKTLPAPFLPQPLSHIHLGLPHARACVCVCVCLCNRYVSPLSPTIAMTILCLLSVYIFIANVAPKGRQIGKRVGGQQEGAILNFFICLCYFVALFLLLFLLLATAHYASGKVYCVLLRISPIADSSTTFSAFTTL